MVVFAKARTSKPFSFSASASPHSARQLRDRPPRVVRQAAEPSTLVFVTALVVFPPETKRGSFSRGSDPLLTGLGWTPARPVACVWEPLRVRARLLAPSVPLGIDAPKAHFCPTCPGSHPRPLLHPNPIIEGSGYGVVANPLSSSSSSSPSCLPQRGTVYVLGAVVSPPNSRACEDCALLDAPAVGASAYQVLRT